MRRGIIVEKNRKFVTLLTPDGQFLKPKMIAAAMKSEKKSCFRVNHAWAEGPAFLIF
ncbi:anti-sigma-I factor rsgI [Bacillus spizizenii]|nr:anti-sigma-I factor rsgI [Bacillus spizizenii]